MEQVIRVPLRHLRESATNPRKAFNAAALQELADSIAARGVMQPIVVRPLQQSDIEARFEVVFGHRRYRASGLAGMPDVPAIVREMSDEEVAIAQMQENVQREDMSAIEEGDGFLRLVNEHGKTADQVAASMGKSRSFVYGRIKLAREASPALRQACLEQGLPGEVAQEIVRLRNHKLQSKALKDLALIGYAGEEKVVKGWLSVRQAKQRLAYVGKIHLDARAPWALADATVLPDAGACSTCPKLACNDPDLADVAADVCTDVDCFERKGAAFTGARLQHFQEHGHQVIEVAEARKLIPSEYSHRPDGFTALGVQAMPGMTWEGALQQLGPMAPKPVAIANPHSFEVKLWLSHEQCTTVLRDLGEDRPGIGTIARDIEAMADWTPAERLVVEGRGDAWGRVRRAVAEQLLRLPRTVEDLRAIVCMELQAGDDLGMVGEVLGLNAACVKAEQDAENAGCDFNVSGWWIDQVNTLPADQLGAILTGLAIDNLLSGSVQAWQANARQQAAGMVALAERYGVDVLGASRLSATGGEPSSPGVEGPSEEDKDEEAGESTDEAAGAAPAGDLVDAMLHEGEREEVKDEAGASAGGAPRRPAVAPVKYRCPTSGKTWTGRGLRPRWVCEWLESGKTLAELEVGAPVPASKEVKDEAGTGAGEQDADDLPYLRPQEEALLRQLAGVEEVLVGDNNWSAARSLHVDGLAHMDERMRDGTPKIHEEWVRITAGGRAWLAAKDQTDEAGASAGEPASVGAA